MSLPTHERGKSMARIGLIVSVALAASSAGSAHANTGLSELRCNITGGFGLVVTSQRATTCVYYRADGAVEFYSGAASRFGVDLGPADARKVIFRVAVPDPQPPGALDGVFSGAGLGVTLGTGISADALVGGRTGKVSLAPVANANFTGVNVNVGIGTLQLQYEGMETLRQRRRGY